MSKKWPWATFLSLALSHWSLRSRPFLRVRKLFLRKSTKIAAHVADFRFTVRRRQVTSLLPGPFLFNSLKSPRFSCGRSIFLALHGKLGNTKGYNEIFPSQPLRLHRSHEGEDAASLRRVAPSFFFIQATLRNVAAPICSRLSDISWAGGGRGKTPVVFQIGKSAFAPLSAGESGFQLMLFGQL